MSEQTRGVDSRKILFDMHDNLTGEWKRNAHKFEAYHEIQESIITKTCSDLHAIFKRVMDGEKEDEQIYEEEGRHHAIFRNRGIDRAIQVHRKMMGVEDEGIL